MTRGSSKVGVRALAVGVLAVALSGCSTFSTSSGSSATPTSLDAPCQQTQSALSAIQHSAGKVSMTVWKTPVTDLSGSEADLGTQLMSEGAVPTESMATNYQDMANGAWAKC